MNLIYRQFYSALIIYLFITGCSSVAPINSSFEGAGSLGKGNLDIMGSYSRYYSENNSREMGNENLGVRIGMGVSEKLDIKTRMEFIHPVANESYFNLHPDDKVIFYSDITFKYSYSNNSSVSLGIGYYDVRNKLYDIYNPIIFTIKGYGNIPINRLPDLYVTGKADLSPQFIYPMVGINIGTSLPNDKNMISIKPEIGAYYAWGDIYYTGGVAVNILLKKNKIK